VTTTLIRMPLALALVATTAACGGSSSKPPASGCTRAAIAPTGPGDASGYFPAGVGSTWNFAVDVTGSAVTRTVTGKQPVGSETASVFSSTEAGSTTVELVVKRPSGVYVLADASSDPLLAAIYPTLVKPFPLVVMPSTQQATCTDLDIGDADGDGKADQADLTSTLRVFSITETTSVAAGNFVDVAHVQSQAVMNVRATTAGPLSIQATQDDWYAPGVGLAASRIVLTIPGFGSDTQSISLVTYNIPTAAAASSGGRASPVQPGGGAHRVSVEEAVLEAARNLGR
jgi:hypothetical protein